MKMLQLAAKENDIVLMLITITAEIWQHNKYISR